jgi:hypothetical protein
MHSLVRDFRMDVENWYPEYIMPLLVRTYYALKRGGIWV